MIFHRRWFLISLFVVTCTAGTILRLNNLGRFAFWTDEYFHVLAARSLLEQGDLYVPTVGQYARAKPVTWITAASFKILGISEFSARLPFVFINMLFIFLGFFAVRKLFSSFLAFMFLGVMCFAPFAIDMSRECRMYTLFQLFYGAASLFFFYGFEAEKPISNYVEPSGWLRRMEERLDIRIPYLVLFLFCLMVSVVLQPLTFNFGLVALVYASTLFVWQGIHDGWTGAIRSKYFILLGVMGLALVGGLLFGRDFLSYLYGMARNVPKWANYDLADTNFYRYLFSDNYPALFYLFPLSAFYMVHRYGKRGLFVVFSFVVPLLLHSYIYGRKSDRYIFYVFPFFVITGLSCLEIFIPALVKAIKEDNWLTSKWQKGLCFLSLLFACLLLVQPWLSKARFVSTMARYPDWKSLGDEVWSTLSNKSVLTTNATMFVYYGGRLPDLYITDEFNERYKYEPGLISSSEDFDNAVSRPPLYVLTTAWNLYNYNYFSLDQRTQILKDFIPVSHPGDKRILLFEKKGPPKS